MDLEAKMEERASEFSLSVIRDAHHFAPKGHRHLIARAFEKLIPLAFRAGYMACLVDLKKSGSEVLKA
jgi:hypothetical protein